MIIIKSEVFKWFYTTFQLQSPQSRKKKRKHLKNVHITRPRFTLCVTFNPYHTIYMSWAQSDPPRFSYYIDRRRRQTTLQLFTLLSPVSWVIATNILRIGLILQRIR